MNNNMEKICNKCVRPMIECYVDDGFKGLLIKNPEGDTLFSNKKNTHISPYVCTGCGFVEWYAKNPERLI